MATSDSPRAMVLVKACCRTLTAFSNGEFAWAKAGAANAKAQTMARNRSVGRKNERLWAKNRFMEWTPESARCRELSAHLQDRPRLTSRVVAPVSGEGKIGR